MPRSSRNINSRPQQVSPLADISVQFKHQGRPFGRVSPHDRAHTATALMWPTSTAAATTQTQFGEPPKRPPAALDNPLQTITAFNYSNLPDMCRGIRPACSGRPCQERILRIAALPKAQMGVLAVFPLYYQRTGIVVRWR
jgi:hypothetical protein